MIAMVTAQHLNNDGHPVYSTYIMGRYWHFVILTGSSYTVYSGLNATAQEITLILNVLKNTKEIIEQWSAVVTSLTNKAAIGYTNNQYHC